MQNRLIVLMVAGVAAFAQSKGPLPGMPPIVDSKNIYSETTLGKIAPKMKDIPARIYVPHTRDNTVWVLDQKTLQVVEKFSVGAGKNVEPQHVVPSWDFSRLFATNDLNNTLAEIDIKTGKLMKIHPVDDPYNMYYTPDGKYMVVMAERMRRVDFRDPNTFKLVRSINVPCKGVNHADYSADGRYMIASCEFSGQLVKIDVAEMKLIGAYDLPGRGMPQDTRVGPDGRTFFVADMQQHGIHVIDGDKFVQTEFIPTGKGCHGIYPSRDAKVLYITNRGEGTISIMDPATHKLIDKWKIDGGGSPDMGGVSADGKIFWISGRYHNEIYGIDTTNGKTLHKIKVGAGPHGLCILPQPGRYSMGHTGNYR